VPRQPDPGGDLLVAVPLSRHSPTTRTIARTSLIRSCAHFDMLLSPFRGTGVHSLK
jgi:hypothetical protein